MRSTRVGPPRSDSPPPRGALAGADGAGVAARAAVGGTALAGADGSVADPLSCWQPTAPAIRSAQPRARSVMAALPFGGWHKGSRRGGQGRFSGPPGHPTPPRRAGEFSGGDDTTPPARG